MVLQMLEFVKFLGMIILIVFLIGVIFAMIDAIYSNIKLSIVRRAAINKLKEKIENADNDEIIIGNIEDLNEEDVK